MINLLYTLVLSLFIWLSIGCSSTSEVIEKCKTYKKCGSECQSKCQARYTKCKKVEKGVGGVLDPSQSPKAKECQNIYNQCKDSCNSTCKQPELDRECERVKHLDDLIDAV